MRNAVGRPVSGDNFFDREQEQRIFWEITEMDNILLLAPRRVGKTSLMFRLRNEAPKHAFQATYLSVAGAADETEFVRKLYDAMSKTAPGNDIMQLIAKGPVGKFFKNIQKVDVSGFALEFKASAQKGWEQIGDTLSETLDAHEGQWLIFVDEIPLFVMKLLKADPKGNRARHFLNWFRDLRQKHESVRWGLAGSIGLDALVARHNMSDTINDLHLQRLGPFSEKISHDFLAKLATSYGITLSKNVRAHIIERVSWTIPYFLQLLFSEILILNEDQTNAPDTTMVDAAFDHLLEPACKNYFDYWRQRLHDELGPPDDRIALALLLATAQNPQGATRQTLLQVITAHLNEPDQQENRLRYLLDALVNDGYLAEENGRFPFRSPLLREFWLRRIGK